MQEFRRALGVTQRIYGKLFDVTSQTISNWESGRAKPSNRIYFLALTFSNAGRRNPRLGKRVTDFIECETPKSHPVIIRDLLVAGLR